MAAIPNNNFAINIKDEAAMFYDPLILTSDKKDSEVGSFKGRVLSLMTGVYLAASYPFRLAAKVVTAVGMAFRTLAEFILAAVSFGSKGEALEFLKATLQALGGAAISPLTNLVAIVRCAVGTIFYPGAAVGIG